MQLSYFSLPALRAKRQAVTFDYKNTDGADVDS